jgi:hypothetical protein
MPHTSARVLAYLAAANYLAVSQRFWLVAMRQSQVSSFVGQGACPRLAAGIVARCTGCGRGLAELDVEGRMFRHFRNPTALALGAMVSAGIQGWPLLDSFLAAGGIPALVPVVGDSSCLVTLYAALVIEGVLKSQASLDRGAARHTDIADQFFMEGVWECNICPFS